MSLIQVETQMYKLTPRGLRPASSNLERTGEQQPAAAQNPAAPPSPEGAKRVITHHPAATAEKKRRLQIIRGKQEPQLSKKCDATINNNCEVIVGHGPQFLSELPSKVACRHLAIAFMDHPGKKSEVALTFASKQEIFNIFDKNLIFSENQLAKLLIETSPDCKHLVCSDNFGHYLTALAKTLETRPENSEKPYDANCLLLTQNHAMALHIERKNKDCVDYFAAKVYDPNTTASYKRVVKINPEEFSSLKLEDLIYRPERIDDYGKIESQPLSMMAISINEGVKPLMVRKPTAPSATSMYMAMSFGGIHDVKALLELMTQAEGSPVLSKTETIAILEAKSDVGTPALFIAFHLNQKDNIQALTDFVLASDNLSNADKVSILRAESPDGQPGLAMGIALGSVESVIAFTNLIDNSNLSTDEKMKLLMAENSAVTTGGQTA